MWLLFYTSERLKKLKSLDLSDNPGLDWLELPFWIENDFPKLTELKLHNTLVNRRGLFKLFDAEKLNVVTISEKFKSIFPKS